MELVLPICHAHPDVSEHCSALRYAAAQFFAQALYDGGWLHSNTEQFDDQTCAYFHQEHLALISTS